MFCIGSFRSLGDATSHPSGLVSQRLGFPHTLCAHHPTPQAKTRAFQVQTKPLQVPLSKNHPSAQASLDDPVDDCAENYKGALSLSLFDHPEWTSDGPTSARDWSLVTVSCTSEFATSPKSKRVTENLINISKPVWASKSKPLPTLPNDVSE